MSSGPETIDVAADLRTAYHWNQFETGGWRGEVGGPGGEPGGDGVGSV